MGIYEINSFRGGLSDFEDKGISGAFKFGSNLDIRKQIDSLSAGQTLVDLGTRTDSASPSQSPSASLSPSASSSMSSSRSPSPSSSQSNSPSPSFSYSPSASASPSRSQSVSPSGSASPSASTSPSHSTSKSPSPSAGLDTVFSDLVHVWVKASDGNLYGFGNTGKVYKIDSSLACFQVYDLHRAIKGACERPSSDGTTYLVFASNTELHIKPLPGNAGWDDVDSVADWPKNDLTSATWHTMKEVGGDVFIANGSTLATVGYDGSYSNEALDLVPGNVVKTLIERNGNINIGTARSSEPTQGINGAIDSEVPLSQVGDDGELYFANMTDTIPVKRFPGGGKVNPGGVTNLVEQVNFFNWEPGADSWIDKQSVGNMALFGVFGADSGKNGIYSYGRKNKNHSFVMNLDYALEVDEIGAVTSYNGTVIASYKDGSDYGVKAVDSTTKATGTYEGLDLKSPKDKMLATQTIWNIAEIFTAPITLGSSVEFWYKANKTGSFVQAYTADGSTSFSTASGLKAEFRIGAVGEIFEPRIVLNPTGNTSPEVYKIRLHFT